MRCRMGLGKSMMLLLPAILFITAFIATTAISESSYANTANISCGDPGRSGTVTVVVEVKHADGTKSTISWNAAILGTDTPDQKAAKIRAAGPLADPDITVGGTLNVVSATTKNGTDKITKMGIANDNTNEKETSNVFAASGLGDRGVVSLSGTAVGGGFIEVVYFGTTKRVNTTAGLTGAQIEDQLSILFKAAGVDNVIDTWNPVPSVATDGRYLYFANNTSGFMSVEVTDAGIENDLAMLMDVAEIPTLSEWGLIVLTLLMVGFAVIVIRRRGRLTETG